MGQPKPIKRQKARNAEYYDMQRTQDDLYKRSLNSQNFIELMEIIQNLSGIDMNVLYHLMRNPMAGQTIEYNDNRLSLFCGQCGRCAITGVPLQIGDIHCHHIIHRSQGGTDRYENLMLVTETVHKLLHATNAKTIQKLLENLNLSAKQKAKLNYYRLKAGLMGI